MKERIAASLLSLAFGVILCAGAFAKDSHLGDHRVTSTGCLQPGTEPNTYVLNSESPGDRDLSRDLSTLTPAQMARVEMSPISVVPDTNVDLKDYVGHRARAKGYLVIQKASDSDPGQLQFRVTSIHRIAGT